MALTEKELELVPEKLFVAWCGYCESPDYAFTDRKDAEEYVLECPYCEREQTLIEVTTKKSGDDNERVPTNRKKR